MGALEQRVPVEPLCMMGGHHHTMTGHIVITDAEVAFGSTSRVPLESGAKHVVGQVPGERGILRAGHGSFPKLRARVLVRFAALPYMRAGRVGRAVRNRRERVHVCHDAGSGTSQSARRSHQGYVPAASRWGEKELPSKRCTRSNPREVLWIYVGTFL